MVSEEKIGSLLDKAFLGLSPSFPGAEVSRAGLGRGGSGKVREWFGLPGGRRLIVTTDRLSAFDRVLAAVPYKGQVLNELSAFWFERTADLVPNHLLSVPDPNAAIVLEAEPLPIEVIVRGYITGVTSTALWRRYELGERRIYGYDFPEGLGKNQALPSAIVTPTTKGGATGHDERLEPAEVVGKGYLDASTWKKVEAIALALFARGTEIAHRAGLVLVDTKYEFGRAADGSLVLIDEVHTPDSSRFWRAASYAERLSAGLEPESLDKEAVRLEYAAAGYRGEGEAPTLPGSSWVRTSLLYQSVYEALLEKRFEPGEYPVEPRLVAALVKGGQAVNPPLLVILMGSPSDEAHSRKIAEAAEALGVESVLRIGSAHKDPARVLSLLADYEADSRPKVYATVAGRSNALSGLVDGAVTSPVIACPPPAEAFGSADLWSSLRMPSGVAPAFVMEPGNAALFAAKIFALADPELSARIRAFQDAQARRLAEADAALGRAGGGGS